ncbi:calcium-binding protein, partial [Ideonella sp.]|uniref:calcium-binding protein n=1 Tax=Ideonella sp. TaxID=1929293 RepID=UPI003BB57E1D
GGVSLATASAATGAWLVGTAGNDALTGTTGHDLLDGGLGVDSMAGGKGDDVYVVDAVGELITEVSGGGLDEVRTSVTLTLAAYVENLVLTGVAALNGTGNNAANRITGNSAANTLLGSGGNDSLIGGDGADKLNGGTGIDWLDGGNGNDTYTVDSTADQVFESTGAAGGTDLVNATVSFSLSAFIENLTLTGALVSDATGNELANKLTGNSAANHLNGGAGVDTLIGNAGADVLEGGLGNDKLTGGADADRFVMLAGGGKDTVTDFAIGIDHIDLTAFGLADLSTVTFKDLGANTQLTLATGESLVLNGIADFHVLSASDFFL